jgi:methylglutaconyl-CoA hydratase
MRRADAMELFLSGEKISAQRAAEVGLINHAVESDEIDHKITSITETILQGGPIALAAAKQMVFTVPKQPVDEAFSKMGELSARLFQSEEAAEGIAAFRERRAAAWVPKGDS